MKPEEVHEYVLTMLGAKHIGVEIDTKDIDVALNQALRKYALYIPKLKSTFFSSTPGVQAYKIDTEGMPPFFINPRSAMPLPGLVDASFDVFKYPFYEALAGPALAGTFSGMGHIDAYFRWLTSTAKVLSAEYDWTYDEETGTALVTPVPAASIPFQVIYPAPKSLKAVTPDNEDLVLDLTLAYAKQILARILRKFAEIPGSTLTLPTDGEALMQEGLEAEREAIAALQGRAIPPPFLFG